MAIKTFFPMRYTTLAAVFMLIAGNADATPQSRMFEVARGVQIHFLEDGNLSRQPTLVFIPGLEVHGIYLVTSASSLQPRAAAHRDRPQIAEEFN